MTSASTPNHRSVYSDAVPEPDVRVGRVYDEAGADDGVRILVDRLWPRGLRKDAADVDEWVRDLAPSTELRRWYRHDPERFSRFRSRYREELGAPPGHTELLRVRTLADDGPVTLLTATRDVEHSHATVLAELLRDDEPGCRP